MEKRMTMEQTAEKCFFVSLILYAISLPITMAGTNFSLALMLASTILLIALRRNESPHPNPPQQAGRDSAGIIPNSLFILAGFFLWAAASDWIAGSHITVSSLKSLSKLWNFLPLILVPLAARKQMFNAVKILLLTGALVALLGIVQYITGIHYFFEGWFGCRALVTDKRFYGFQSHPLHSGGLYTILFLVSLSVTLFFRPGKIPLNPPLEKGETRYGKLPETCFWITMTSLLGLGVIITQSRSYYLASFAGSIVILGRKGWKTLAAGLLPGLAIILCLASMDDSIAGRIRTISWNHTDESGRQRIYMWTAAASMIREHPFAGVGYGNWGKNIVRYSALFPEENRDSSARGHAHNSYLTVASETGLTGLAIFLLFWAALVREQVELLREAKGQIPLGKNPPYSPFMKGGNIGIPPLEKGEMQGDILERDEHWESRFEYALAIGGLAAILSLFVAAFFEHNLLTATVDLALFFVLGLSRISAPA